MIYNEYNISSSNQTHLQHTTPSHLINSHLHKQTSHLWEIATINTQGLNDITKRELWFTYLQSSNFQIIIHTETNSKPSETHQWQIPHFKSWWCSDESQNIGQGIGISIRIQLSHRVFKLHTLPGRIIALDLSFPHKKYVRIIAIYFPATSQLGKEKTASYAKQLIDEAINKQWHIIIAGDFNAVSNPQLDKSQTNKTTKHHHRPTSSLLKHLVYQQFTDTFRSLHPYKMEYTWSNSRGHASRIDQIWISNSEDWLLTKAEIVPLDPVILPTDHNLMKCTIESWPLTQGQQAPRLRQPNDRYSWNSTSDLQWKKYNEEIERQLAAKIPDMKPNTEQEINHSWNIFRDTILKACANNITKIREKRRSPKTAKPQATHIILLNKLVHISKLCVREQTTTNHLKLLLDLDHQLLNKHHITILMIPSNDANFL
jgi:exonuclease III